MDTIHLDRFSQDHDRAACAGATCTNDNLPDRKVITIVIMLERLQASCMAAVSDEDPPPKDVMTDSPEGKFHPV